MSFVAGLEQIRWRFIWIRVDRARQVPGFDGPGWLGDLDSGLVVIQKICWSSRFATMSSFVLVVVDIVDIGDCDNAKDKVLLLEGLGLDLELR